MHFNKAFMAIPIFLKEVLIQLRLMKGVAQKSEQKLDNIDKTYQEQVWQSGT